MTPHAAKFMTKHRVASGGIGGQRSVIQQYKGYQATSVPRYAAQHAWVMCAVLHA